MVHGILTDDPLVQNAAFPGEEAHWLANGSDGKKIFYIDLPEDTYTHVIFSKVVESTKTSQTENIELAALSGDNCIYLVSNDFVANNAETGHYTYSPS